MLDVLSRPPLDTYTEFNDIDDSFPDDPSSSALNHYVGPRGPILHNVAFAYIPSEEVLSTCPLHTNSVCAKEMRIIMGPR